MSSDKPKTFKVNQTKRRVTVYRQSIAESDFKIIDRYREMGYEIEMLEKTAPRSRKGISRKDIENFFYPVLEENDKSLLEELKKKNENKENILAVKSWLRDSLKASKNEKLKPYIAYEEFIKSCKKIEMNNLEEEQKDSVNIARKTATKEAMELIKNKKEKELQEKLDKKTTQE